MTIRPDLPRYTPRHAARRRIGPGVLGGLLLAGLAAFLLRTSAPASALVPPHFGATLNFGDVFGCGWIADDDVTVTIKDAPAGSVLFSGTSPTDGGGCFVLQGDETGQSFLSPGWFVAVDDGTSAKDLILEPVAITLINTGTDVVSGTAAPGEHVEVNADDQSGEGFLETDADGTGAWTVDFTGTFDVTGFSRLHAAVLDGDGDKTTYFREAPHLEVNLDFDDVSGCGWTNGSVNIRIRATPGGVTLFNGPAQAAGDRGCIFDFGKDDHGLDLVPGMSVQGTQSPAFQVVTLVDLSIDSVDAATDVMTGTAPPNAFVTAALPEWEMTVQADGNGDWTADFTGLADIVADTFANAKTPDDDGDFTAATRVAPHFYADLTFDNVNGCGFDSPATLTVRAAPAGAILFSGPVATDNLGCFDAAQAVHGRDLVPGMSVEVSSGAVARQLTLVPLTLDAVDAEAGTWSGTAPPFATVLAAFSLPERGDGVLVTADANGDWFADFGGPIEAGPGETLVFFARVDDADGDGTVAHQVTSCFLQGSTLRIGLGSYTVRRGAGGAFEVTGSGNQDPSCGGATVNNVDLVEVEGNGGAQSLTIDLGGGQFAPGVTTEPSGTSEIEFQLDFGPGDSLTILGVAGVDTIRLGTLGIDLNGDQDPDVTDAGGPGAIGGSVTVNGGGGADTLSAAGGLGTGTAYPAAVGIDGGDQGDLVTGGLAADTLAGGGAGGTDRVVEARDANMVLTNTSLQIGAVTDSLSGFEAATLTGGAGGNTLDAGAFTGTSFLSGLGGADTLIGGTNADNLFGGDLGDTLTGGGGVNFLSGEAGIDRVVETANVNFTLSNGAVTIGGQTSGVSSIELATLTGGAGANVMNAAGFTVGAVTLNGLGGADTLTGGPQSDVLMGGTEDDTLTGGGGSNNLQGELGTDRVVETGNVNFTLTNTSIQVGSFGSGLGSIEQATLTGGPSPNVMNAQSFSGAAILMGLAGTDTLTGGSGNDQLLGGTENDTLSGRGGANLINGEAGVDLVTYAWASGGVNVRLGNQVGSGPGFSDNLSQVESAVGSAFNDSLTGSGAPNFLGGGGGNDIIELRDGIRGNDTASGDAGFDVCRADQNDQKFGCEAS